MQMVQEEIEHALYMNVALGIDRIMHGPLTGQKLVKGCSYG